MTTSTTSIDIMGLQAAYANVHTDQERDYFMQRYHDVISSFGGKTSYDADNRPLLVMRSNLWASGYVFFSSRRRHTRFDCDWSSDMCSSDLHQRYIGSGLGLLASQRSNGVARGLQGQPLAIQQTVHRSEERRVGKECRSRWSPYH